MTSVGFTPGHDEQSPEGPDWERGRGRRQPDVKSGKRASRSPFSGAVLGGLSSLASPLGALFVAPILARALGPVGRGELAAVLAPLTLADTVAGIGTQTAGTYFVAKGFPPRVVIRLCVLLVAPVAALVYAVLFATAPFIGSSESNLSGLIRLAAIAVFFGAVMAPLRGAATGMGQYQYVNLERWLAAGGRAAVIITLATISHLTVATGIAASLTTGILASWVLFFAVRTRGRHRQNASYNRSQARGDTQASLSLPAVAAYSTSTWVWTIGASINARLDQVLLAAVVGAYDLGLYAVAVTLAELPAALLMMSQRIALAELSGDSEGSRISMASRLTLEAAAILAVAGAIVGPSLIAIVFGHSYSDASRIFLILVGGSVLWSLSQVLGAALAATGHPKSASTTEVAGVFVTLIGILTFCPAYGIEAAAWVAVAAYGTTAVCRIMYLRYLGYSTIGSLILPRVSDLRWVSDQVRRKQGGNR